jgi:hypothetical protein
MDQKGPICSIILEKMNCVKFSIKHREPSRLKLLGSRMRPVKTKKSEAELRGQRDFNNMFDDLF